MIGEALVAAGTFRDELAWERFSQAPKGDVLKYAPGEYLLAAAWSAPNDMAAFAQGIFDHAENYDLPTCVDVLSGLLAGRTYGDAARFYELVRDRFKGSNEEDENDLKELEWLGQWARQGNEPSVPDAVESGMFLSL
ncbi:hypothetical protein [Nesterenkonia pannonica]|uniref:hypothetical protein n=1 Tax=Nesterenkonia pannonica TaxID=1548602 RepID=UPI0021641948|nr:hypothetical protein [Nesterenkonia pannonica]